jgi:hypothetical protein
MNYILDPFLHKFVIVFMDYILVYNSSLQEHAHHLQQVPNLLRDHKFYVKLSNCAFAQ